MNESGHIKLRGWLSKDLKQAIGALLLLCNPMIGFSDVPKVEATKSTDAIPIPEVSQSADHWNFEHTPMSIRIGLAAGMEGGGPIRYNTRFPEVKPNPHPTSYYHAPSFFSVEVEYAFKYGALLLGVVSRRDFAHNGITSRSVIHEGDVWTVDRFEFHDTGLMFGWVFGERFREAWWSADFTFIGDRGGISSRMTRSSIPAKSEAQVNISAVSFRARASVGLFNAGFFQLSAGPEIHIPAWYRIYDKSDLELQPWIANALDLKASAGLGLAVMSSIRF